MADDSENTQQFEQVLSRLDALMKRGQTGDPAAAVPPAPQEEAASEPPPAAADGGTPFVILEEPSEIPLLTEIYDGAPPPARSGAGEELAEAVIDALMPLMLENLDIIVAEEAARMQQHIAERLRLEIAEALRARLRQQG